MKPAAPASARRSGYLLCLRAAGYLLTVLLAGACSAPPEVTVFPPDVPPARLSEWGLVQRDGDGLVLGAGVTPYDLNTPLFSDYALKLRTWYLPPGTAMGYRGEGSFDFPVGSIVTKTFFYPTRADGRDGGAMVVARDGWDGQVSALDLDDYRLVETRLLVRREGGWEALPYVWDDDGRDAHLAITGALRPMRLAVGDEVVDLPYVVPARSECAGCHATDHTDGTLRLIGLKARHLNRAYPGSPRNQLEEWADAGRLAGLPDAGDVPAEAVWNDPHAPLAARARAYLDSNCGHCHNAAGAADTSGLLLDASVTSLRNLGVCKPPIAAGGGTGGRSYSIVPGRPDESILLYRLETTDPAARMPEAGRAVTHREGVQLIRAWIESLPGACV